MRLTRGTIGLLLFSLMVIVGVGIFQQPIQTFLQPATPDTRISQLLPFGLDRQANRLVVRRGEDFTEIQRMDDQWQVVDASTLQPETETNHDFVVGVLRLLEGIEYSQVFDVDDVQQYGFDVTDAVIEIDTIEASFVLQIGSTNPDGDKIYVRLNDDERVYVVPAVFELSNILRIAAQPPYIVLEPTADALAGNLLFPDIFGYQVAEFSIRDERDGSTIRYTQGEQGTWILDGTVVNQDIEVDHVQAAINVSQFLFLEVDQLSASSRQTASNVLILTLSMTIEDGTAYTMFVYTVDDDGYIGVLDRGEGEKIYHLPTDTVSMFFDMIYEPPYAQA